MEGELLRMALERDREEEKNRLMARRTMLQEAYKTNKKNLVVKKELMRQSLEAEKFENERNAFIMGQREAQRRYEEQKKRERIDEIAYENRALAGDIKRRDLERHYEEKRKQINDTKLPDPHIINAQDHYSKVYRPKPAKFDAYRQGKIMFNDEEDKFKAMMNIQRRADDLEVVYRLVT